MPTRSSTKKGAKPAKATAKASRAKSKPATSPSEAKTAAQIRDELGSLMRRLRKPRIAKVAAEIIAYAKTAGTAFADVAQELGALQKAAAIQHLDLVTALLDAGVDPNTDSEEDPGEERALAAALEAYDYDADKALAIVGVLLARGANPDALWPDTPLVRQINSRRECTLDSAVKQESLPAIDLLATASSPATRAHALNTILLDSKAIQGDRAEVFDRLLAVTDLDVGDHDGMFALHAAAQRGDAALFERLYARANTKLPRLVRDASMPLELAGPPGGGTRPTLKYPAGATPIAVARMVKARLAQTFAEYQRPGVDEGRRTFENQRLTRAMDGCAAILVFMEARGHTDDTQAAPLAAPLATVLAACLDLAASLGIASFAERAALIDTTHTGAFGYFMQCAKLIRPELDDAARAKLEQHLVGKFITGSLERHVQVGGKMDEIDRVFGPDPDTYCVWPENYPEEFRSLLESAAYYGVHGDAVLGLELRDDDTTKLWEISPTARIDHGPVDQWVKAGVAALLDG